MHKSVLLYGDSIFWGVNAVNGFRHDRQDRVDVVIREKLGESFDVIAEGLRGRTMFGENGAFPERNGLDQFGPIFASHIPVDLVVIMLGTNDLNAQTRHSADDIAAAVGDYNDKMRYWCDFMKYDAPKLLIVSPPDINDPELDRFKELFAGSAELVEPTVAALKQSCETHSWDFLDIRSSVKSMGSDGIHLDPKASRTLAIAIAEKISKILQ